MGPLLRFWSRVLLFLLVLTGTGRAQSTGSPGERWLAGAEAALEGEEPEQAAALLGKAARAFEQEEDWTEASRTWSRQGKLYRDDLGMMDEAIEAFNRIIDLHRTHSEPRKRDINVAHFYNLIGGVFQQKGDYDKAIDVYGKAKSIRIGVFGENSQEVAQIVTNIATAWRFKGEYENAEAMYGHAMKMRLESPGTEWLKVGIIHHQLGEVYLEWEKPEKAAEEFRQAEKLFRRLAPERLDYFVELWVNQGRLEVARGDLQEARARFSDAMQIADSIYGPLHRETAKVWVAIGRAYLAEGAGHEAITAFQRALTALIPDFRPRSPGDNPGHQHLTADPWVFVALTEKAAAHAALKDGETALATYEAACEFADLRRAAYWSTDAKRDLAREVYPAYENAIRTARELYESGAAPDYLYRAFTISERSKAALILENLDRRSAFPAGLLDSIKDIEKAIHELQKELYFLDDSAPGRAPLADKLFRLQERHGRKLAGYQEQYLDFSPGRMSVTRVREELPPGTVLLEYFMGPETIYAFLIGRDRILLKRWDFQRKLIGAINEMRNRCARPPEGNLYDDRKSYLQVSAQVYQQVFQPLEPGLELLDARQLIIVPDGPLWYVPFEALIRRDTATQKAKGVNERADYADQAWLGRDLVISYAHSGTLLERNRHRRPEQAAASRKILALAPDYGFYRVADPDRKRGDSLLLGFSPLPWGRKEVEGIAGRFRTHLLLDSMATEKNFKALARDYAGIHFSTHASLNDQNPMYSFIALEDDGQPGEDDSLFLYELYGMELNAEMVVLSACETGAGGLVKGEGIMSLARGFAYGGCPSVVMSLWKADDRSTFELMEAFYAHLAGGSPKAQALQSAKMDYLSQAEGRYGHPYYWAHMVALGDPGPVDLARAGWPGWWWMMGGMAVLVVLGGWWARRRRMRG